MKKEFCTKSAEETKNLGQKLSQLIGNGWILFLEGNLGSGKTTFTKGIALGFGIDSEVTSPTFAIEQIYKAKEKKIAHYDFYRIKHKRDPVVYGALEEIRSGEALTVIEWGELLKTYLPEKTLYLKFVSQPGDVRNISIMGKSAVADKVVKTL